jgi:hypothetical protein
MNAGTVPLGDLRKMKRSVTSAESEKATASYRAAEFHRGHRGATHLDNIGNDTHGSDIGSSSGSLDDERALRVTGSVEGDDVVGSRE